MFNRNKTGELVVKPRVAPRLKLLITGAAVTVLILGAGWIYNYGLSMAGFDRSSASRQQQKLETEIHQLRNDNQELREGLARAQRNLQMDQTAYQELERSLKASAQEIVKLREELNFYRNIISPADKKSGLRIQSLNIEPVGKSNEYRYKLVLIQALKHERTVYGQARFEISGTRAGETAVLHVPSTKERPINVNFKYFQDIEGKFALPKDFRPQQIKVNVMTRGGARTAEETYPWPQA